MGFKKFSVFVVGRTVLAMVTLILLGLALNSQGYHAVALLLLALLVGQLLELIRFVAKTNAELLRFFNAAKNADYSQRFDLSNLGSGFDELGKAFDDVLKRLQTARARQEEALKHLKAVVEHVPVPLISVTGGDQITLWNNSARRLFGSHSVLHLEDLRGFNANFPEQLQSLTPGRRALLTIDLDGIKHQLSIAATELIVGQQQELLVSLQDIQSELDTAQLDAWQDLVRVLTHEIMNSITPIASLANTAVDLTTDAKSQLAEREIELDEL